MNFVHHCLIAVIWQFLVQVRLVKCFSPFAYYILYCLVNAAVCVFAHNIFNNNIDIKYATESNILRCIKK